MNYKPKYAKSAAEGEEINEEIEDLLLTEDEKADIFD